MTRVSQTATTTSMEDAVTSAVKAAPDAVHPDWLPTARALAAVWDGPELVQYVVNKGPPVEDYHYCESRGESWWSERPGVDDTVPDLSSSPGGLANVGVMLDGLDGCRLDKLNSHSWEANGLRGPLVLVVARAWLASRR